MWIEKSTSPDGILGTINSAGTPLAKNGWARFTIGQIAGTGDTSGTAVIDVHTASTPAGCRFIATAQTTN